MRMERINSRCAVWSWKRAPWRPSVELQRTAMPSSDRLKPARDRPSGATAGGRSEQAADPASHAAIEPPQYFDPTEPWDAQSAEALTRLYESGEPYQAQNPQRQGTRERR